MVLYYRYKDIINNNDFTGDGVGIFMSNHDKRIIKGIILGDYVRTIRKRPEIDWEKYLLPEDKPFLHIKILDSEWYPFSTLERMTIAIVKEIAGEDMDVVRNWGRLSMDKLTHTNKSLVCANQPMESLMRFKILRGSFFNFDPIKVILITSDNAKLEINYGLIELAEKAAAYHTLGYIERLLQLSSAREINFLFEKRAWEGAPATALEIDWNQEPLLKKVRGAIFVDYVKMIKSRKDIDWNKYLLGEDLTFLTKKIEPDEWYPFPAFERMGVGILKEIANDNFEMVRLWGKELAKILIQVHESVLKKGDPMESLMRFQILRGSFFDFDPIHVMYISPTYAKFEINYSAGKIAEKAATYQALGYFEMLLQLADAKSIDHKYIQTIWDGAQTTILEIFWE